MELRLMATAFLACRGRVLMMCKKSSRLHDGEFWSGLGGHMEPDEITSPKQAILREICEESGLEADDIRNLRLRYILLRIKDGEIRQQFVYFGETDRETVVSSDEGELFWIEPERLQKLPMSRILRFMLKHALAPDAQGDEEEVKVGVITMGSEEEPLMQWAELRDPKVF